MLKVDPDFIVHLNASIILRFFIIKSSSSPSCFNVQLINVLILYYTIKVFYQTLLFASLQPTKQQNRLASAFNANFPCRVPLLKLLHALIRLPKRASVVWNTPCLLWSQFAPRTTTSIPPVLRERKFRSFIIK